MGYHESRQADRKRGASRAARAGVTAALTGLLLTAAASATLVAAGTLPARADAAAGKTVDIDMVSADLPTVINLLQQQTGLEFSIQDTGKPFGKVTVGLNHASLDKALRIIANSANATVTRDQDGVYVFRPAGEGASTAGFLDNTPAPVAAPAPALNSALPPSAQKNWRKLPLNHAIPTDILRTMHWPVDQSEVNPFVRVQLEDSKPSVSSGGAGFVNNSSVNPYGDVPSVPVGRGGAYSAEANRSADPQAQANQFPGGPTIQGPGYNGGGFGRGGFQGQSPNQFGGQQGGGFQGNPFQQGGQDAQGGQTALPEGVDRIFALEGDNSLFIEATPDGFNRVRDIVKNLDIAPRQVQIKVEFVTASVTDVDAFGINFSLVPFPGIEVNNNQGAQANQTSIPQTYVSVASGNIVAELFASLVRTRGKVVQAPLITTTNNVTAQINIATQIPFITTTNIVGGNGNVTSNTAQNFLTLNTGLAVSPRINSDDTVTLNLSPRITDTTGQPALTGGPPPSITQSLNTLRTVHNGETMVLGGLVRKSESNSQSRIPFLGDLPIIGSLFRNRVNNVADTELLIFVTPTIINDNSEGPATAAGLNTSVAP